MPFSTTPIPDLLVFEPQVFGDARGFFFESYNAKTVEEAGITQPFVQDNQSHSVRGVLRGLHYQHPPFAQTKLLRVLAGEIFDVAVDIRRGSPAYGRHYGIVLSAENKNQLFVPRGFAHGFVVLSEVADVMYKCDDFYSKQHEGGILYNDPALAIDWKIDPGDIILSDKDQALPTLADAVNHFTYAPGAAGLTS